MMLEGWKTAIGIFISLVGQLLTMYGADSEAVNLLMGDANQFVAQAMALGGLGLALYGRAKAVGPMLNIK